MMALFSWIGWTLSWVCMRWGAALRCFPRSGHISSVSRCWYAWCASVVDSLLSCCFVTRGNSWIKFRETGFESSDPEAVGGGSHSFLVNITGTICIWVPRNEECVSSKNCTDWSLHGRFILNKISYLGELSWESASLHKPQKWRGSRDVDIIQSVGLSVDRLEWSTTLVHNEIFEQLLGGLP